MNVFLCGMLIGAVLMLVVSNWSDWRGLSRPLDMRPLDPRRFLNGELPLLQRPPEPSERDELERKLRRLDGVLAVAFGRASIHPHTGNPQVGFDTRWPN